MKVTDYPKRFYTQVEVAQAENGDGWGILLDQRPVRTPARIALVLPTRALAAALAEEWAKQPDRIELPTMTLTRLSNVALDRTPDARAEMIKELAAYAETDLTCHLELPGTELRSRQDKAWRPWRDWAGRALNVLLVPVEGIIAAPQPAASLDALRTHAESLDDFRLTGLSWACALFGSVVLALAVERGQLSASAALEASCLDEDWQIEQWGEDAEAQAARATRQADADALDVWLQALST